MIISSSRVPRLLIPRWRSFANSLKSGELAMPLRRGAQHDDKGYDVEFVKRLAKWRTSKDLVAAAEVVETALVVGEESSAIEAAEALLSPKSDVTSLVRRQASLVIDRLRRPDVGSREPSSCAGGEISFWRRRTRNHLDDPLAWSELSLARLVQGEIADALKSMQVALRLSPHNRYILRAAARLFCHVRDRARAYDLIRRNEATGRDPWLMAAEIALAQLNERKPVFLKKGLEFIERRSALPRQITELASAIGTFYLHTGLERRSKKMFLSSLADPTANSLAQAEWVSPHFRGDLITETQWRHALFASEAQAKRAFRQGDFNAAFCRSMDWVAEERFSSRAYMVAAAFASILEDFTQADKLARDGLRYNPKSVPLNNSLVFSLARQGKLDAAEAELQKMSDVDDPQGKLVAEANRGLIAMRRGNLDLGETLYRRVISRFRQEKMFEAVATAHAYFAYEAIIAKHPLTFEILKEAKHWAAEFNAPIARHVIGSADKILNHYNLSGDFTSAA